MVVLYSMTNIERDFDLGFVARPRDDGFNLEKV
jgi:hypothetical protein